MTGDILILMGGIGLFLIGMETMTDALRQLASRRAREVLARFTTTPFTGVLTGAATTAVIQSSSATTVTTIGFVGAGLLSFPQALGILFGANIGTTMTGWIVMLVGFKLKLGAVALPLLLVAALARLLGRGALAAWATVASGFCLVFVGLDMMQTGMAAFEGQITPASFPPDTLAGRLLLVGMGMLITVVTQSSSAGVATTLVLLGAGSISFPQAAALVIGMHVGTTFTAVLASLGGSRAMRRTAVAGVLYMVGTGILAFVLLDLAALAHDTVFRGDHQIALVAFHTGFNLAGVLVMLPLTSRFARFVAWLVPDPEGDALPEPLDRGLLGDPASALDVAGAAADGIARRLFAAVAEAVRIDGVPKRAAEEAERLRPALEDLEGFIARIRVPEGDDRQAQRMTALMHQFDHLQRLAHRAGQTGRIATLWRDRMLRRPATLLSATLARAAQGGAAAETEARLERIAALIVSRIRRHRRSTLLRSQWGDVTAVGVFQLTDAMRWLGRVADHVQSITHYGRVVAVAASPPGAAPPAEGPDSAAA